MADESLMPASETAPSPAPMEQPSATPLDEKTFQEWHARIKKSIERDKKHWPWWDAAMKAYEPELDGAKSYGEQVSTKRVFTGVERKMAELFYQKPELNVAPSPLLEELGEGGDVVAMAHGDILNEKLGTDGVDVKRLAQRNAFDYLITGFGWSVMGYRAYQRSMKKQMPVMDPTTGQPAMRPAVNPSTGLPVLDPMSMQPQMEPVTEEKDVPVTVKSECFWEVISPKQKLIPDDYKSLDYDKAPWLGWRFTTITRREAKRLGWKLPERGEANASQTTETHFDFGDADNKNPDAVTGVQLWYRSCLFRDDIVHPDHLTELILVDGCPTPVVHRDCPLQKFDERGRLTPDSLIGFPLHALTVRTKTDDAYVMSDASHWIPLEAELNKGRDQMIKQRDANLLKWLYNTGVITKEILDKAVSAQQNGCIGLPTEAFAGAKSPFTPMERGTYPPENFTFNSIIDNDLSRASAIDSAASGTSDQSGLTATEVNIRQSNVNVRLGWEQGFVADWFVKGATKFSTILQQFLPQEDAAQIVGSQRAQMWEQFRHKVPTRFAFTLTPDSALRNDTPLERKMHLDLYTFVAKDPTINRDYMNRQLMMKFRIDPTKAIIPQTQRQKPEPEPSTPTIAIKDLGVFADPVIISMVMANPQWKIIVPPEVQALAVINPMPAVNPETGIPEHPGKVAQAESLSKHQSDETGAQNGSGQMVPQMGGGLLN